MYSANVTTKRVFIPIEKDDEITTIPMRFGRINVRHASGVDFYFSVTRRKGRLTFRDSRDKMSYTVRTIKPELSRMLGEPKAVALISEAIG